MRIVRASELRPRIDLLADTRYLWQGSRKYVELDPQVMPGHIFRVRRRVQTEKDFDYFM